MGLRLNIVNFFNLEWAHNILRAGWLILFELVVIKKTFNLLVSSWEYTVKMRLTSQFFQRPISFSAEGCSLVIVHVDSPLDVCLQRDAQRAVPVGEEVIRKMSARFEHLDAERIWWERLSVVFRQRWDFRRTYGAPDEQTFALGIQRKANDLVW